MVFSTDSKRVMMQKRFSRCLSMVFFVISMGLSVSSQAERIPGMDVPLFEDAVERWLEDNDVDSLPMLSNLARQNNTAARLLLSRIEMTDRAPSDYVQGLSRSQRLALFRSDVDKQAVFHRSWLKVESDQGTPLAQILFDGSALGISLASIRRLYEVGEREAAEHRVKKMAADGSPDDRRALARFLPRHAELAPYLRAFRLARDGLTPSKTALQSMIAAVQGGEPETIAVGDNANLRSVLQFVGVGYQAGARTLNYGADSPYYNDITQWILSAPQTIPIANACRAACAEADLAACVNTAFGLAGGYYQAIRLDSPLETVISQSRFLNSQRAKNMLLRWTAAFRSENGKMVFTPQELKVKSRCLAEAVARENP